MEVRTIMLSTMWFTQQASLDSVYSARKAPYYYRVCYSFHSSYSELRDMALYLKPAALRPNVIPYKEKDFSAVSMIQIFIKVVTQTLQKAYSHKKLLTGTPVMVNSFFLQTLPYL